MDALLAAPMLRLGAAAAVSVLAAGAVVMFQHHQQRLSSLSFSAASATAGAVKQEGRKVAGEFRFRDGVLMPHEEFLYGYSPSEEAQGRHFIVGKKLPGWDYSSWEEKYQGFGRVRSVEVVGEGGGRAVWETSLLDRGRSALVVEWNVLVALLLGVVVGAVGVLLMRFLKRRVERMRAQGQGQEKKEEEEVPAPPSSAVEAERAQLDALWRTTLIKMYREKKGEVLSLTQLVGHQYDRNAQLEASLAEDKVTIEDLVGEMEVLQSEKKSLTTAATTANERIKELEKENKALRLDKDKATAGKVSANEKIEDLEKANAALQSEKDNLTAATTTAKETIQDLEKEIEALQSDEEAAFVTANERMKSLERRLEAALPLPYKDVADESAKKSFERQLEAVRLVKEPTNVSGDDRREQIKDVHPVTVVQDDKGMLPRENFSSNELGLREAAGSADKKSINISAEQRHHADAPGYQEVKVRQESPDSKPAMPESVQMGEEKKGVPNVQGTEPQAPHHDDHDPDAPKLGKNGKPLIPRKNRRKDRTVRTRTHPEYVPPAAPQRAVEEATRPPPPLGDRPFHGARGGFGGRGGYNGPRGGGGMMIGGGLHFTNLNNSRGGGGRGGRGGRGRGRVGRGVGGAPYRPL